MYNGIKENEQKALDYLCACVMEMSANGREQDNHICDLRLFEREQPEKTW